MAIAPSGAASASGWKIEARSSTPSMRRGPGRLKNAAPSTPTTRASPTDPRRAASLAARGASQPHGIAITISGRAANTSFHSITRERDLLGNPMARIEEWVEPLEAGDARPREPGDSSRDEGEPRAELVKHAIGDVIPADRDRDPSKILEHALDGGCVEGHDQRLVLQVRGQALERDGANRAERLTEDYVRTCRAKAS